MFTVLSEHKLTPQAAFWVLEDRQKRRRENFLCFLSIRQPDITKSVARYQLAIDEVKVRLSLAVSPGTWLMPSNLVLNTQSTVGYNNNLKKATGDMKLGVNNDVNLDTKKVEVKLMNGVPSKTKRPTSHPSNPIHQQRATDSKQLMIKHNHCHWMHDRKQA